MASPAASAIGGKALQQLEDELRMGVEPAFFEGEDSFRPFNQVIEILGSALDSEENGAVGEGPGDGSVLEENALYQNVQRQLNLCSTVVEKITVEHHSSLNSSVQAMGGVARHYNETRTNVATLRDEVRECKMLLLSGQQQGDMRDLWQRKAQYAQILKLLDMLDVIHDAPVKFDKLVRQKRFVEAVDLINASLEDIFSDELCNVTAISEVRDELLQRKGLILDILVREVADAVFLRTAAAATANINSPSQTSKVDVDSSISPHLAGLELDPAEPAPAFPAARISAATEQALDDPSADLAVYLQLLVEAILRLRALHDAERFLMERLCKEVELLGASQMRACGATAREFFAGGEEDNVGRLAQYLRMAFESYALVIRNIIFLVKLIQLARIQESQSADGGTMYEGDVPLRQDLPISTWRHIQDHLIGVLSRHLSLESSLGSEGPQSPQASKQGGGRLLREMESTGGASAAPGPGDEFDYTSAAAFTRSAFLCSPSPFAVISFFNSAGDFVRLTEGMLLALRREALETAGHLGTSPLGGSRTSKSSSGKLADYLSQAVQGSLLPVMMRDSNSVYARFASDSEAFMPYGVSAGDAAAPAAPPASLRHKTRAGRAAEAVYAQLKPMFWAMLQMPQFVEQIGSAIEITLENYYTVARDKFAEFCGGSSAYMRHQQSSDKLRAILSKDPLFLRYKATQYGAMHPFAPKSSGRGRAASSSSAVEVLTTENVFESEWDLLYDMRQSKNRTSTSGTPKRGSAASADGTGTILSLRRLQAAACLAHSCDWLASRVLRMSLHVETASAEKKKAAHSLSPRRQELDSPAKLRAIAQRLSGLADDCLITLRLDIIFAVSSSMEMLPAIELDIDEGRATSQAMSLGGVEDKCIVDLSRRLQHVQEALSPVEPKLGESLISPRELFAYVVATLPWMLPRLLVNAFQDLCSRRITAGGVGKLTKISSSLRQTLTDVVETSTACFEEAGARPPAEVIATEFGSLGRYVSLLSMTADELKACITSNPNMFTMEQWNVQWKLHCPSRRPSEQSFESWWASRKQM